MYCTRKNMTLGSNSLHQSTLRASFSPCHPSRQPYLPYQKPPTSFWSTHDPPAFFRDPGSLLFNQTMPLLPQPPPCLLSLLGNRLFWNHSGLLSWVLLLGLVGGWCLNIRTCKIKPLLVRCGCKPGWGRTCSVTSAGGQNSPPNSSRWHLGVWFGVSLPSIWGRSGSGHCGQVGLTDGATVPSE